MSRQQVAGRRRGGHRAFRRVLSLVLVVALGWLFACTPGQGGWDFAALGERYPDVEGERGQRLGDAAPYFAPVEGGLVLFLCHWDPGQPLTYALPESATAEEQDLIEGAVRAWEDAGLGLRFERTAPEQAALRIDFVDPGDRRAPPGSATTAAECAVVLGPDVSRASTRIPARIVSARIRLRRTNVDVLGREVELSPEELAGTVLHELGHALGFPSHVADDSSIMSRSVDRVRDVGRALGRGRGFSDPTLRALYRIPSGEVVGFLPLEVARLRPLHELALRAKQEEWAGPYVRVGDRSARIGWLNDQGDVMGFRVRGTAKDWSREFELIPTLPWLRLSVRSD